MKQLFIGLILFVLLIGSVSAVTQYAIDNYDFRNLFGIWNVTRITAQNITANKFFGDGSGLTGITATAVASWDNTTGKPFTSFDGSTITSVSGVAKVNVTNVCLLNQSQSFTGNLTAQGFRTTTFSSTPALYADTDTNTGPVFSAPDVFALQVGGVNWLQLTANGVGINGYTTMAHDFTVNGTSHFSGDVMFMGIINGSSTIYENGVTLNSRYNYSTIYNTSHFRNSGTSQNPYISLNDTAVTQGTYGSASVGAQITIDKQGRITSASNVTLTGDIAGITTASSSGLIGGATSGTPSLSINYSHVVSQIGNWSQDKTSYNTTSQLRSIFVNPSSSGVCTYGIANATLTNSSFLITCAAQQSAGGAAVYLRNSTGGQQLTTEFNFSGSAVAQSFVDGSNISQIILNGGSGSGINESRLNLTSTIAIFNIIPQAANNLGYTQRDSSGVSRNIANIDTTNTTTIGYGNAVLILHTG